MTRRRLWLALAAVAVLLLVGRATAALVADYRWYAALGATDAWSLRVWNEVALRAIAFAVGSGIAFANLWGVRHSVVSLVLPRQLGNIEIGEEVPGRALMVIVVGAALILGVAFAVPASDWQSFVLARGGVGFDENDPYFNADFGFFVYWLPFERATFAWTVSVVTIVSVVVVGLYALTPSLRWDRGHLHVSAYVRRHLALIGALALALLAWSFRLDAYGAMTNGSGPDGAFGAFDYQMGIPVSLILAYAAIGSSLVVAWAGWTGQTRVAVVIMTVILLLTPTMRYALPVAVRWASAPVDPAVREVPFAGVRALYTRRAFAVDRIRGMTPDEAWHTEQDAATVSVWDPAPLTRAIERTRRRGSVIGGAALEERGSGPVFLSVEAPARLENAALGDWTLVRTLAAVTDERGAVVRVDAAGRFPLDDQPLGPVLVYEGARGYAIVADSVRHPAAPLMDTFMARLTEAWSQQNFRLLRTPAVPSRIVNRRDVRERVRALVPFFAQGRRIEPLVHGDSLMWVLELYSVTPDYPLSRRFVTEAGDESYVRHAATALVQAYTGRVTFIPDDESDPIARTWIRRLPATMGRLHDLPASLVAALPPDVDGAELQAEAFAAVGSRTESASRRSIPALDGSDTLVSSREATLVWSPSLATSVWLAPVLDAHDHLSGVLVASGGAHRALRWFRAPDTTTSWSALLERLHHVADSAGGRGAAAVAAGRVRLVPLANGKLVALQPFYDWPSDGPPRVDRIAVASGDSLGAALSIPAAVGVRPPPGPTAASADARAERMRELYAEMRAALQRGDWRAFGAAFDALGALLERR